MGRCSVAVAGVMAGLLAAGCGSTDAPTWTPAAAGSPVAAVNSPAAPATQPAPSGKGKRNLSYRDGSDKTGTGGTTPPDPLAPPVLKPVIRNGQRPHPRIKARPARIGKAVVYPDGVSLTITRTKQSKVAEQGPGVVNGPVTLFTLVFHNGSQSKIGLNRVVVTAEYGEPARLAGPVYVHGNQDFAGTVPPRKFAKARYGFRIPLKNLDDVTIAVDYDGQHSAAVFSGPVP